VRRLALVLLVPILAGTAASGSGVASAADSAQLACTVVKGGPKSGASRAELLKNIAFDTSRLANFEQKLASLAPGSADYVLTKSSIKEAQGNIATFKRALASTPANPCLSYWTKTQLWTALKSPNYLDVDGYRFRVLGPADSAPYPSLEPLGTVKRVGGAQAWSRFRADACIETSDGTPLEAFLIVQAWGPVRTTYPYSTMALSADPRAMNNFIDGAGDCPY
jgi:hypothetical protein